MSTLASGEMRLTASESVIEKGWFPPASAAVCIFTAKFREYNVTTLFRLVPS